MNPQINAANAPLYDVSVSFDGENSSALWHRLLFLDYSKLDVSEIMGICRKCQSCSLFTGIIYWYRNLLNNKLYIGKTINPHDRHQTHLYSSKIGSNRKDSGLPIHRAIQKYGIDNFEYRVLCIVANPDKQQLNDILNEKEKYYIQFYHSNNQIYGYNILDGGNSSPNAGVRVRQYSKFGEYISIYDSIAEAKRQTGCKNIANAICKHTYYSNGYVFVPENLDVPTFVFDKYKKLVIHQYSKEGQYLQTFDSAKDAAKQVNGDQSRIELCAKPPCQNIAYGFRWSHEKVGNLQTEAIKLPVYVCQYDQDGNFVNEYDNISIAAKSIDKKSGSHISACLNDLWRKAGGYYWRTFKTSKIDIPNEKVSSST